MELYSVPLTIICWGGRSSWYMVQVKKKAAAAAASFRCCCKFMWTTSIVLVSVLSWISSIADAAGMCSDVAMPSFIHSDPFPMNFTSLVITRWCVSPRITGWQKWNSTKVPLLLSSGRINLLLRERKKIDIFEPWRWACCSSSFWFDQQSCVSRLSCMDHCCPLWHTSLPLQIVGQFCVRVVENDFWCEWWWKLDYLEEIMLRAVTLLHWWDLIRRELISLALTFWCVLTPHGSTFASWVVEDDFE